MLGIDYPTFVLLNNDFAQTTVLNSNQQNVSRIRYRMYIFKQFLQVMCNFYEFAEKQKQTNSF